eukprot:4909189-Pyramimonas_sp.AAC.1
MGVKDSFSHFLKEQASGMGSTAMDRLRGRQLAASTAMGGLPSMQEMQSMSDDKFAKLLEM